MKLFKSGDPWASIVILLTVGLFSLSLVVKGFTHDLFLESGVFLVSVKLILMAGKNAASEERMERHLKQINALLSRDSVQIAMKEETSVLSGSTLRPDNGANKKLYGREISAHDIVLNNEVAVPASTQLLLAGLNKKSPSDRSNTWEG
jgi:lipid-binding SYLF domain-containing protein